MIWSLRKDVKTISGLFISMLKRIFLMWKALMGLIGSRR